MPQFPVHSAAPGKEISIGGNSCCMVRSTGNLHYNLTTQGLSDAGHILPAIISMAQTAVIAAPPGVHLAIGRENHCMARTTSNLRNTDTSKGINEGGFVLVAILYAQKGV